MKEFQRSWDQVTLSAEADARISAAIEAARQERGEGSPHGSIVKKGALRLSRGAAVAAMLAALLIVTTAAAGLYHTTLWVRPSSEGEWHCRLGEEMVEVGFEDPAVEPHDLGRWGPTAGGFEIIAGCCSDMVGTDEPWIDDKHHGDWWVNADGAKVLLSFRLPNHCHNSYALDWILEQGDISVNGVDAWYLVHRNSVDEVLTTVFWTVPDAGVGFTLVSYDLSIDELIPIAESVAPCESHTLAESTAP